MSLACGAFGAAFQNLGFEDANTNYVRDLDGVPPIQLIGLASDMLPAWHLSLGTNSETLIGLDAIRPGPGYASIFTAANSFGRPVVDFYSLSLNGEVDTSGTRTYIPYSLIQTGELPADAKSIQFLSYGSPVEVRINGSLIPLFYSYEPPTPDPTTRRAVVLGDVSASQDKPSNSDS